ncbi:hypothetical protein WN48_00383 [Eufriesea mexicana]|uniref:Uncharacterized protein n=1 Tax=Eufriesea mexicana TaxID=516756 RepID=A0A310S8N5_9HYME|nr:hypothetical protein WN48_00383 [Eufriesea mexicana]
MTHRSKENESQSEFLFDDLSDAPNSGPASVIDSKLPLMDAEDSSPRVLTEESFNDVIRLVREKNRFPTSDQHIRPFLNIKLHKYRKTRKIINPATNMKKPKSNTKSDKMDTSLLSDEENSKSSSTGMVTEPDDQTYSSKYLELKKIIQNLKDTIQSLSTQLREERERRRIAEDFNKSLAACVQTREGDKDGNSNAWSNVLPKRKSACHESTPDPAKASHPATAGMPEQVGKQAHLYSTIGKRPKIATAVRHSEQNTGIRKPPPIVIVNKGCNRALNALSAQIKDFHFKKVNANKHKLYTKPQTSMSHPNREQN